MEEERKYSADIAAAVNKFLVDDDWRFETVDWMPGIAAPTIVEAVPVGNIPNGENSRTNYSYVATAVDGTTGEESMPSPVVTVENVAPLSQSYYIRITISPVEGASEYRIYKKKGGVYGYIGRITGDGQAGIRAATMTVTMPAEPLSDPTYYINVELSGFVEPVSFEWRDGDIWTAAPQVGGSLLTNKGWRKNGESWQLVSARMPAGEDPKKQWLPGERMRVCDSGGTPVEITLPDWRKKATAKRESGATYFCIIMNMSAERPSLKSYSPLPSNPEYQTYDMSASRMSYVLIRGLFIVIQCETPCEVPSC